MGVEPALREGGIFGLIGPVGRRQNAPHSHSVHLDLSHPGYRPHIRNGHPALSWCCSTVISMMPTAMSLVREHEIGTPEPLRVVSSRGRISR